MEFDHELTIKFKIMSHRSPKQSFSIFLEVKHNNNYYSWVINKKDPTIKTKTLEVITTIY